MKGLVYLSVDQKPQSVPHIFPDIAGSERHLDQEDNQEDT